MKQTETLMEFLEVAEAAAGEKTLLTSQQENDVPDGMLGDEDSGGASVSITVQALLKTPEESFYFSETYEDSVHYEEALKQLQALEQTLPSEKVEPFVIDQQTSGK